MSAARSLERRQSSSARSSVAGRCGCRTLPAAADPGAAVAVRNEPAATVATPPDESAGPAPDERARRTCSADGCGGGPSAAGVAQPARSSPSSSRSRCAACTWAPAARWRRASCSSSRSGCSPATCPTSTSSTCTDPARCTSLMGWYRVFGYTLESERTFGLLQHLGDHHRRVRARRGRGATGSPSSRAVDGHAARADADRALRAGMGGWRSRWRLWSVVFGVRALHTDGPRPHAGARPPPARSPGSRCRSGPTSSSPSASPHGVVLWLDAARGRGGRSLAGAVVGLMPMWIHLAVAGIGPSWRGMVTDPVLDLRPGPRAAPPAELRQGRRRAAGRRRGPARRAVVAVPGARREPPAVPVVLRRSSRRERGRSALARLAASRGAVARRSAPRCSSVALLGLGMLPQALQRPDSTHLAWGSCVSFALLPALVAELVAAAPRSAAWCDRVVADRPRSPRCSIALVAVRRRPFYTYRYYLLHSRDQRRQQARRVRGRPRRPPLLLRQRAAAARQPGGDRRSRRDRARPASGCSSARPISAARSTATSSSTTCSPSSTPATYFIEMDPGLADAAGLAPRRRRRVGRLGAADQLLDRLVRAERVERVRQRRTEPGRRRPVLPRRQLRGRAGAAVPRAARRATASAPPASASAPTAARSLDSELAERGWSAEPQVARRDFVRQCTRLASSAAHRRPRTP